MSSLERSECAARRCSCISHAQLLARDASDAWLYVRVLSHSLNCLQHGDRTQEKVRRVKWVFVVRSDQVPAVALRDVSEGLLVRVAVGSKF